MMTWTNRLRIAGVVFIITVIWLMVAGCTMPTETRTIIVDNVVLPAKLAVVGEWKTQTDGGLILLSFTERLAMTAEALGTSNKILGIWQPVSDTTIDIQALSCLGAIGRYEWKVVSSTLTFSAVVDSCGPRRSMMEGNDWERTYVHLAENDG